MTVTGCTFRLDSELPTTKKYPLMCVAARMIAATKISPTDPASSCRKTERESYARGAHFLNSILSGRAPPADKHKVSSRASRKPISAEPKSMATRKSSSDATAFCNTRVDEYSRDSHSGGDDFSSFTAAVASSSANSRSAGKPRQREDESYYFSTSSPPPSLPEPTVLGKKLPTPRDQSSSDANDDERDTNNDNDQGIQTLARLSAKKEELRISTGNNSFGTVGDSDVTVGCLGFQMELRACLDANDNRESVCMWHFRMWQKCKTEQQECKMNTKFGAFGL